MEMTLKPAMSSSDAELHEKKVHLTAANAVNKSAPHRSGS
jgi:hypothetical protein